jgi:hypothetical protein
MVETAFVSNAFVRPYEKSRAAHPSVMMMMTKDNRQPPHNSFSRSFNNIQDPLEKSPATFRIRSIETISGCRPYSLYWRIESVVGEDSSLP